VFHARPSPSGAAPRLCRGARTGANCRLTIDPPDAKDQRRGSRRARSSAGQ
jgi:hypothetical protein